MPVSTFEVRSCNSCGLRYPLPISDEIFSNKRCPACIGDTSLILSRDLRTEPAKNLQISSSRRGEISILLDNVRSAWNVGSILRTADGFGFTNLYLCGITPTPENKSVKKTSLGAETLVTWKYHKNAVKLATDFKANGVKLIALEEHERSIPLDQIPNHGMTTSTLLIVGNEISGVDPHLLELCDEIYIIPMRGGKKSFNVAIAFSIAAYTLKCF